MAYSSAPLVIFLIASVFFFGFLHALNIGLHANAGLNLSQQCSRTCESMFCDGPPSPLLRYGKYCGFSYSGCPGEKPCDGLDACCMHHDQCIDRKSDDYLSVECNRELQECVKAYRRSGAPSFEGNTCRVDKVVDAINTAMEAAVLAGETLGKH